MDFPYEKIRQATKEYVGFGFTPLIFIKDGLLLESSLADWRNMSATDVALKIDLFGPLDDPALALSLRGTEIIVIDCGFTTPETEEDGVNFFLRYFNGGKERDRYLYKYPKTLILAKKIAKPDVVIPETAIDLNGKRSRIRFFFRYPGFVQRERLGFTDGVKRCGIEILSGSDFFFAPPSVDPKSMDDARFYFNNGKRLIPWDDEGKKNFDFISSIAYINEYPEIKHLIDQYWLRKELVNLAKPEEMFHDWDTQWRKDLARMEHGILHEDIAFQVFLRNKTIKRADGRLPFSVLFDCYNRFLEERRKPQVGKGEFSQLMETFAPYAEKRKIGGMYFLGIVLA